MVALLQLINKFSGGVSAVSLGVVSLFGFRPGQPSYGPTEGFGLLLFNLALPAVLLLVAAAVAWTRYPITQRRHRAIARALERRSRAAAAPAVPAASALRA
jgi:Na+/melibiose symporter-like transporter